eukprot:5206116-Pleurochrysis_carterae.AAC.1
MWGTSAGVDAVAGKQVGERLGQKLSSVIAVNGPHDACGEMYHLEPGVVVNHYKRVTLLPILRRYERPSNIYVDEPTRVARSVHQVGTVR